MMNEGASGELCLGHTHKKTNGKDDDAYFRNCIKQESAKCVDVRMSRYKLLLPHLDPVVLLQHVS